MGRIEHRRPRPGHGDTRVGPRRLPPVGFAFLGLAAVAAVIELWPIVNAIWIGATTWPGEVPRLLPQVARAAGMVVLPAAVAWASPTRYRTNGWLWKGALIVAIVQLLRYAVDFARDAVLNWLIEGGASIDDPAPMLINIGIGLALASLAVLGVWALGEGIKDAGGQSRVAVAVSVVASIALGLLLVVPAFMGGVTLGIELIPDLLSVAINMLFVLANGLLAGRAIAGVIRGLRPVGAWRGGAIGATVVFLVPVLSLGVLLVNSYLLDSADGIAIPFLGVASWFGWPLVALSLAAGMGRLPAAVPGAAGSGFVMRGRPRHVPAPAA
jgi:hypothetical protein